jgi:hypothetical protein
MVRYLLTASDDELSMLAAMAFQGGCGALLLGAVLAIPLLGW